MVVAMTASIAALVSAVSTRLVLRYARRRLVDPVNQRSSHRIAKPRGGGLGLVAGMLAAWLPMMWLHGIGVGVMLLALALLSMAALGWWDDHCQLSARFRLPLQLALVGLVYVAFTMPDRLFLAESIWMPTFLWWYLPLAILGGGWMVNLTNFMDGIDGIAASQGLVGCLGLSFVLPAEAIELQLLMLACAAACIGFLIWNRPPAKIFMGDVGSTTLGLVFAIGILGGISHGVPLEELLLPLAPFVADATCTLMRRAWRHEHLSQGHRSHLYQRLAKRWESHLWATLLYGALAAFGMMLSLMVHYDLLPPLLGISLWLIVWAMLVLYGSRVCPAIPS